MYLVGSGDKALVCVAGVVERIRSAERLELVFVLQLNTPEHKVTHPGGSRGSKKNNPRFAANLPALMVAESCAL